MGTTVFHVEQGFHVDQDGERLMSLYSEDVEVEDYDPDDYEYFEQDEANQYPEWDNEADDE